MQEQDVALLPVQGREGPGDHARVGRVGEQPRIGRHRDRRVELKQLRPGPPPGFRDQDATEASR